MDWVSRIVGGVMVIKRCLFCVPGVYVILVGDKAYEREKNGSLNRHENMLFGLGIG